RQGEPGQHLCWLADGRVRVRVEDEAGLVYDVASLGPGALFGETALLQAVPRTATVLADGPVQVVTLSRDAFARLWQGQAASAGEVREHIRTAAALRSHPLFQALDAEGLRGVLGAAEVVQCAAGDDVVTQNQAGDHLYVVREGSLRVHRSTPKGPKLLAKLQAGDWFGELALLGAGARTATVTAETPCGVVRLHRDAVDRALSRDVAGALVLLEAAAERMARLRAGEVA
ncbi:MAG: cyclic nucleotide-binding domain-containing protein, partial [Deltaproteobacteria bacterium]|nr:cyclic nucleotide-binding domain-containing protein [Deltaproteobacteria bacterium]